MNNLFFTVSFLKAHLSLCVSVAPDVSSQSYLTQRIMHIYLKCPSENNLVTERTYYFFLGVTGGRISNPQKSITPLGTNKGWNHHVKRPVRILWKNSNGRVCSLITEMEHLSCVWVTYFDKYPAYLMIICRPRQGLTTVVTPNPSTWAIIQSCSWY